MTNIQRNLYLVAIANLFCILLGGESSGQTSNQSISAYDNVQSEQNIDAHLNDLQVISVDHAIAVGDRGLIVASQDGGKSWRRQDSRTSWPLYGIAMADERRGWTVGGTILRHSERSCGLVLRTMDGGKSWQPIPNANLPRLTGIAHLGRDQLIAWGDISFASLTSVFISHDGGSTWAPLALPTAGIVSAAWESLERGVIIDRLNRVFLIESGNQIRELYLPVAKDCRWKMVRRDAEAYWLLSEHGQIARSVDGLRWQVTELPGEPSDRGNFRLRSITVYRNNAWVVGDPGNVLWKSNDNGRTWSQQSIANQLPITAIGNFGGSRLIAGNCVGAIIGSRNGGEGWWVERQTAKRVSVLNLAHSLDSACWSAVGFSSNDERRVAAVAVLISSYTESYADLLPDIQSRASILQSDAGLAFIADLGDPLDPAGRPTAWQRVDLEKEAMAYQSLLQRAVQVVRSNCPDVVIVDQWKSQDPRLVAAAQLGLEAVALAADESYRVFSPAANVAERPWKVGKVFFASTSGEASINFDTAQLVSAAGRMLGEVLQARSLIRESFENQVAPIGLQLAQSELQNALAESKIHGGLVLSDETIRPVPVLKSSSYQILMGNLKRQSALIRLTDVPGSKVAPDPRWNSMLDSYLQTAGGTAIADSMLDAAERCRDRGYWLRWRSIVENIIVREPASGASEKLWLSLFSLQNSTEFAQYYRQMVESSQLSRPSSPQVHVGQGIHASPFEGIREGKNSPVVTASFSESVQPPNDLALTENALDAYASLTDRSGNHELNPVPLLFPAETMARCVRSFQGSNPQPLADPRFGLIEGSRQRRGKIGSEVSSNLAIYERLMTNPSLAGWSQIGLQEMEWSQGRLDADRTIIASRTRPGLSPHLDGLADEAIWQTAIGHWLTDPYQSMRIAPTEIRVLYDDAYLYVWMRCPKPSNGDAILLGSIRKRDGCNRRKDYVTVRLDTDRDYATWFEFDIDADGQVAERCGDFVDWNPQWFVAHRTNEIEWSAEIAIPLNAMIGETQVANTTWAASFYRRLPRIGTQHDGPIVTDQNLPQAMNLLFFRPIED